MDISFSSKPQTLLSSVSLPSFASSHLLLPVSIRREFPGRQPRPLGLLRSQRSRTRLGSRTQPPRCLLHDPFYVDSVLVVGVAVAVFVAVQAINLSYSRRRRGAPVFPDKEVSDVLVSGEPCKQDIIVIIEEEDVRSQSLQTGNDAKFLTKEVKNTIGTKENTLCEQVYACDIKDARLLETQKTCLTSEVIFSYKMPPHPGYKFTLITTDNAFMESSEAKGPNCLSVAVHEGGTEQGNSDNIPDMLSGELQAAVDASDIPTICVEYNCSAIPLKNKQIEVSQDTKTRLHTVGFGELLMLSYKGLHRPLVNELSKRDEGKQLGIRSISCFKGVATGPTPVILQLGRGSYPQVRPAMKVAGVLAKHSPLTSELVERCVPIAYFKEGSVNKQNESFNSHCSTRDIRRSLMHNSDKMNISGHQPNGTLAKDANDPLACLRTYNRLLHDARLNDCLDLLESMERESLLDMEKVYHTKFLEVCKSQKAVKEAFRFIRLIRKPTLSTFNMLLSICAHSQDFEGAFQVMLLVKEAGFKPDCKLYTTMISTCAKSGKVDAMFEVFHEMVNAGVEPNVNTYGALIDGCARAGQVAKAFGAYGIMRSKKVQPDRVIFNGLITACGQSGAVDRAFDVLAEMMAEPKPLEPDHVTVGALMKTCIQAGQVDRAHEVYRMLRTHNIKGTADVYTIAVRSCSLTGDLKFALSIYDDMTKKGVMPDEMFLSTLVDVAGHAGKVDAAFEVLRNVKKKGIELGNVSYSSLMGACCNANNWQKALELYEDIKAIKLLPTVSTLNALITALCDGDQLLKSIEVLHEMKEAGVRPNIVTYSILLVACEKKHEAELGFTILSEAKSDGILPNLIMCRCLTGLCLWSFEKAYSLGEPIVSFDSGRPQIDNKWTSRAIMAYRETISAGVIPTIEVFSQVLGCLKFPCDTSSRERSIDNLGIGFDVSKRFNVCSLLDGFGEYDTRSFSVLEEAASLGIIPRVSFKESPITVDARKLQIHTVEVYILTILKALKHRLAAGSRLPNITILLPIARTQIKSSKGERTINLSGRVGQAVGSLLRRLGLPHQGGESYGKIRINGLSLRRWFKLKIAGPSPPGRPTHTSSFEARLAKGITDQQRNIRSRSFE